MTVCFCSERGSSALSLHGYTYFQTADLKGREQGNLVTEWSCCVWEQEEEGGLIQLWLTQDEEGWERCCVFTLWSAGWRRPLVACISFHSSLGNLLWCSLQEDLWKHTFVVHWKQRVTEIYSSSATGWKKLFCSELCGVFCFYSSFLLIHLLTSSTHIFLFPPSSLISVCRWVWPLCDTAGADEPVSVKMSNWFATKETQVLFQFSESET